ncbi:hypothetical protein GY45DRAFT_1346276 [Cubamyces sp. BRFM 1775]|nr:hypothetical protein GY45DRAFT_1346276 [Cubamyces sp. BRFM 1775]
MKAKTARLNVKARQPYDDAKSVRPRVKKVCPAPTHPPAKPSNVPPATNNGAITMRSLCLEFMLEVYPAITPRHDYDLIILGTTRYDGTPSEVLAWVDRRLEGAIRSQGSLQEVLKNARLTLDTYVEPTGKKPRPDDQHVFIRTIPDSEYSIRLYPGSISAAEFCMDFVHTATGQAVNSPFPYELWSVPNPALSGLSVPMVGRLKSAECVFGIRQEDILPGEEKFFLRDGQTCLLKRPGKRPLRFTVPIRQRQSSRIDEDVDVLDLPEFIV